MNTKLLKLMLATSLSITALPAMADTLLCTYTAEITEGDKYNSSGTRLNSVSAIIRQDRANLYAFDMGDYGDEYDCLFSSKSQRARIPKMLSAGYISPQTKKAILYGTPYIQVRVYKNSIRVDRY
ncbi:hypothetical protein [Psychrobacter sp. FDAARGOS_221]|uniref:hypothetical protein n=1 Tax=Psychrobacter sp. FDAARGOS_221 TaxID=1975705 RepID=UPI000BB58753|nr:hypothetical protein [Psychrobacter sp. FDAARGOS_221]PNK60846.1 hypothetical protein A6J60_008115 [Psychrobacter sp. FDAARGOS_221]